MARVKKDEGRYLPLPALKEKGFWEAFFSIILFLFYLYSFVKLRDQPASAAGVSAGSFSADDDGGDLFKQVAYILMFGATTLGYFIRFGFRLPKSIPIVQYIFLAWLILSFSWSPIPAIAFRRSVLTAIIVIMVGLGIELLGTQKAMRSLYWALAVGLLGSYIAVFLFPQYGVHPSNESDPELVGRWRGVFYHKNIAGGLVVAGTLMYIHFFIVRRSLVDFVLIFLSLFFLYHTHSKTSIGLFIIVLPLTYIYRYFHTSQQGRLIFIMTGCSTLLLILIAATFSLDKVTTFFSNPHSLSGRLAIWSTAWHFVLDHPLLGSGYNSFWPSQPFAPCLANPYMTELFLHNIGHSHNGYLEILVTTGVPGVVLAIIATVLIPVRQFFSRDNLEPGFKSLLFGIWLFGLLDNMMEPQLYSRDRQVWCMMVTAIFGLNALRKLTKPEPFQVERFESTNFGRAHPASALPSSG